MYDILAVAYIPIGTHADVAQAVEHFLGKEEVMGSSPIISSNKNPQSPIYWALRIFCLSSDNDAGSGCM